MMVVYKFSLLTPGAPVRITDAEGSTVDEGTTANDGTYTVELDAGSYVALTDPDRAVGHTQSSGVAVANDGDVLTYNEDATGYVPEMGGSIKHYEATWAGDFDDEPDVITTGDVGVTLGAMNDNGNVGFTGIREVTLTPGIYFVSWGGSIATPDTVPDAEDPQSFANWKISWNNSSIDLSQSVAAPAPVVQQTGGTYLATVSMVAPIIDPENDILSIRVDSPYGGLGTFVIANLTITRLGNA